MKKVYKCLASDFTMLKNRIKRITKKLDKYGKTWAFEVLGTAPECVTVIDRSNNSTHKIITEVTSYYFEMEPLMLGNYKVIAIIEHNATKDGNNVIKQLTEGVNIPKHFNSAESKCDHCNINRYRNKTVLLLNQVDGNIKQVGTSCLEEYTGINCLDVLGAYRDIYAIITDKPYLDSSTAYQHMNKYTETVKFLASCINEIDKNGYQKQQTKYKAWDNLNNELEYGSYIEQAHTVINYFKNKEFHEPFLNDIKKALSQEYTKCNGLVAYAYIAYQQEKEREAEQERLKKSQHVGNIGDRITVNVTLDDYFVFDDFYSYNGSIYLYIFSDDKGNRYIWKTRAVLMRDNEFIDIGDELTITGTVKGHTEYKGEKQTELTRCKVK